MRLGSLLAALLAAAAVAGAPRDEPAGSSEVGGQILSVGASASGALVVVLAVGEEQELTLRVSPDTKVTIDGEGAAPGELEDAQGALARARYRETASGLVLDAIDLSRRDQEGE